MASGLYRAEATDGHRAIVVQGLAPEEDPPWPGFKETPDDAFEANILPKGPHLVEIGKRYNRWTRGEEFSSLSRLCNLVPTPPELIF